MTLSQFLPILVSGAAIAILSGILYIIGLIYIAAFMFRLSAPITLLDFDSIYYMTVAVAPAIVTGILFSIPLVTTYRTRNPRIIHLGEHLPFLYVAGAFFVLFADGAMGDDYEPIWLALGTGAVICWIGSSIAHWRLLEVSSRTVLGRAGLVICVLIVSMAIAYHMGSRDAERLMHGATDIGTMVVLHFMDASNQLEGKPLILVTEHEGKYYLVDPGSSTTRFARMYVVARERVSLIEMQRGTSPWPPPTKGTPATSGQLRLIADA